MLRSIPCLGLSLMLAALGCVEHEAEACERRSEAKLSATPSMLSDTNALLQLGASTLGCVAHAGEYRQVSMQRDSAGLEIEYTLALTSRKIGGGGSVRISPSGKVRILRLFQ